MLDCLQILIITEHKLKGSFSIELRSIYDTMPLMLCSNTFSGAMGSAVIIDKDKLSRSERTIYDKGWEENQFNLYVSDMIGLRRTLPEMRHKE